MDAERLRMISLVLKLISILLIIVALGTPWLYLRGTEDTPLLSVGDFTINKASINGIGSVSTDIPTSNPSSKLSISISFFSLIGAIQVIALAVLSLTTYYWFYLKTSAKRPKREDFERLLIYDLLLSIILMIIPLIVITLYPSFKLHYALYQRQGETLKLVREDEKILRDLPLVMLGPGSIISLIAGIILFSSVVLYGYASNKDLL